MSKSWWLGLAVALVPIAAASQEFVFVEAEPIPPPPPSAVEDAGLAGLQVSVDGKHLYALYGVAIGNDLMLVYERGTDGALTLIDSPQVAINPNAMVLAQDGSAAFVAGNNGDLEAWRRDATTGLLTLADAQYDGAGGGNYLQYPSGIAVSPDGKNVYVAGQENAVTSFAWDGVAGTLTLADTDVAGEGSLVLNGTGPIEVTSDGAFVLVVSLFDKALVVFARDPGNGMLSYADRFVDGVGGVNGLDAPTDLVVAPRSGAPASASVYLAGPYDRTLANFDAQPAGLSFVEAVPGGSFPNSLAVSAGGTRLYVTDTSLNRVAAFQRDPGSGGLGPLVGEIADGDPGVSSLAQPNYVAASPDGHNVYVASSVDDAITVFLTPVPEPASAALGVAAVGGVAGLARRRSVVP